MPLEDSFKARAKGVRAYLRSLGDLETRVAGVPGRTFYQAAKTVDASRAASFLMIYNSVEHGMHSALTYIRSDIRAKGADFVNLRPYWKQELVRAQFHSKLKNGVNLIAFLDEVSEFIPGKIDWGAAEADMPFSGNIDHEKLLHFANAIGVKWKPPPSTLGGSDLQLVRKMRNDLAHGNERFEDVGSAYTTQDLVGKFDRIRTFMVSYLNAMDRYASTQSYIAGP